MLIRILLLVYVILIAIPSYSQKDKIGGSRNESFTYDECGCESNIILEIYNGLYPPYGGQLVVDPVNVGAVTIANLNDTDNDGDTNSDGVVDVVDRDDMDVLSSVTGRDEVDLMKLIISATGPFPATCTHVELKTIGMVELWEKSTKGTIANRMIPLTSLPKTLWVEGTHVSSSVRDIEISAYLNTALKATVKATAIWVEKQMSYYQRDVLPTPFSLDIDESDLVENINNIAISQDGTRYGFGTSHFSSGLAARDRRFGGRILFEYKILPVDIKSELATLGIKYDITRRKNVTNKHLSYTSSDFVATTELFPLQIEKANDDPAGNDNHDEDVIPINDRIFSWDTPNEIRVGSPRAFSIRQTKFQEFTRVSFDQEPDGETLEGSRCSDLFNWNISYGLKTNASMSSSNPLHQSGQTLDIYTELGVTSSPPRLLTGSGNGNVNLTSISVSPDYKSYILRYFPATNEWTLSGKVPTGFVVLETSNSSITGPWIINTYPYVDISISNGDTPFTNNTIVGFNIAFLPLTSNSFTSN